METESTDSSLSDLNHNYDQGSANLPQFIWSYFTSRTSIWRKNLEQLTQFSGDITIESKMLLVRNMYWGRTSFYKTSFHILVILITTIALYSGLGTRIASSQRSELENLSVSPGYFFDSDLVNQQGSLFPLEELGDLSDSLFTQYTVKAGDSLNAIADTNGINADTIRWANDIPTGRDTLAVGQQIKIPKVNGVLITVEDGDTIDKILGQVNLSDAETDRFTFLELNAQFLNDKNEPIPGSQVLIPDATLKQPDPPPTRRRTPAPRVVNTPATAPAAPPGVFVNPMQLSGGYGFSRGYSFGHTGIDLTVSSGSWIAAAGAGTVTRAGWCFSLGYCVAIAHANGYQTVYGHGNGVLAVSPGQQVVAGQRIMQSGCTGLCFGAHVHISLSANNQDVYSCYSCRINPAGIIPY